MSNAAPLPSSVLPRSLAYSHAVGAVSSTQTVNLALGLPVHDQQGLDDLINRLYDPKDPLYGKYLKPAEFAQRFSPTQEQYDALAAYYQARGFQVTGRHANRLLLDVSAPASVVSSTFGVKLGYYQEPSGRVFYSADREPEVPTPSGVPVATVIGLDNAAVIQTFHRALSPVDRMTVTPSIGTGLGGGLSPSDIKHAYSLDSVTQTGTGQKLALVELDGYDPADVTTYETTYGLTHVPLQDVSVDNASGPPNSPDGQGEVTLDIELQAALAPGAAKILVYRGQPTVVSLANTYAAIADDNLAPSISCSWGVGEVVSAFSFFNQERAIFQQMATQGQSFFAASGDSGAYNDGADLSVSDPASQPEVIGVGGTTLALNGTDYGAESAWGDPSDKRRSQFGAGGGGGVSALWPKQSYQTGFGISSTARNVPDVSLDSDPNTGYSIYFQGQWTVFGGTSCAAPLWSAYAALVNQKRVADGRTTLGFANKVLYPIALTNSYSTIFHDINDGSTNLFYPATTGYDNATGLGSFIGNTLFAALAPPLIPAPNAPTGVSATPGSAVVLLKWTAVPTAKTYTVWRANVSGGPYVQYGATTLTYYYSPGVVNGTRYYYVITASNEGGTSPNSAEVSAVPASAGGSLVSLVIPVKIAAGVQTYGTVTLSAPAPAGGSGIHLSSTNRSVLLVDGQLNIPAGATSASFAIRTLMVNSPVNVNVAASLDSTVLIAPTTVLVAAVPASLTIAPNQVIAGVRPTATVTLSTVAPAGGALVTLLSSDTNSAGVYYGVVVPAGATSATFPVTTKFVASTKVVTITAASNGVTVGANLTITPAPALLSIALDKTSIISGTRATATVTLTAPATPGGVIVNLASDTSSVTVLSAIKVLEGETTASIPVVSHTGYAAIGAKITATLRDTSKTATLNVTLPVVLTSLTIAPTSVVAGASATGTVQLSYAPTADTLITLTSNVSGVKAFSSVTVPAGYTTANFSITTKTGMTPALATISATLNSVSKTATLNVTAAAAAKG
ncbi:protease pro-enzyme activation domain-containing protein [Capsulimonas corticalis]|uniref:protease pro-enzyme activation domain-containing protein n=1 Tax=Capsulimonas corticalis TaxID=2219043 RepID=UPI001403D7D6|nr:protease pro-enzyme activation domain-containing protein [Capsulimonas corticalis]